MVKNKFFYFLTLGTLVHLRHFKLGCSYAAQCYYYRLSDFLIFVLKPGNTKNEKNYYKSPEFNILTALKKMFKIFFFRLFYVDAKKEF